MGTSVYDKRHDLACKAIMMLTSSHKTLCFCYDLSGNNRIDLFVRLYDMRYLIGSIYTDLSLDCQISLLDLKCTKLEPMFSYVEDFLDNIRY